MAHIEVYEWKEGFCDPGPRKSTDILVSIFLKCRPMAFRT